jgi:hypothetical protein
MLYVIIVITIHCAVYTRQGLVLIAAKAQASVRNFGACGVTKK